MGKGSVVILKSGGPRMAITGDDSYGNLVCEFWNAGKNEFDRMVFPPEALSIP